VLDFVDKGLKAAVLEVQEYVRLQITVVRAVLFAPFYMHDLIEQLDQIGIGSLTVVVLAGFFTGAVLALQTGITLDQFGARPFVGRLVSASMVKELGPVLTGLMLAGRVGSALPPSSVDGGDRSDQRAAGARHRSDPQAGRAARARRRDHDAAPDDHRRHARASSAAGSSPCFSCASRRACTGRR
jgi:hypothetical protein